MRSPSIRHWRMVRQWRSTLGPKSFGNGWEREETVTSSTWRATVALLDWERVVRRKRYRNTAEVKADFPAVAFIGKGRAVFNIAGNACRLVVKMDFRGRCLVLVRHVVTHKEYERLIKGRAL